MKILGRFSRRPARGILYENALPFTLSPLPPKTRDGAALFLPPLWGKRRDAAPLFPPPLRGKRKDSVPLFPPPLRGRARVGVIFILHCAPSRAWVLLIMFRIDQTNVPLLQDVPGDGTYLPRPGRSFPRLPFWKGHKFFYNTLIWE